VVITYDTPRVLAGDLSRRAWSPVLTVMGLVVTLAGAGLFNLMLISFLRRKRHLGMLRALGMDSSELGLLLILEAGLMSALGLFAGWGLAAALIWQLNRFHEPALHLVPGAFAVSAVLAAGILVLGSFIPVTLSRRATVDQLLYNRRVYLSPNPSCAQCGRCGGF
jgi:putative ABC transport system permease protein